jgi:hypothetical protein
MILPMIRPTIQLMIRRMTRRMIQLMIRRVIRPMIRPATQPTTRPATRPTTQPATQPMTQLTTQPTIRRTRTPAIQLLQTAQRPTRAPQISHLATRTPLRLIPRPRTRTRTVDLLEFPTPPLASLPPTPQTQTGAGVDHSPQSGRFVLPTIDASHRPTSLSSLRTGKISVYVPPF